MTRNDITHSITVPPTGRRFKAFAKILKVGILGSACVSVQVNAAGFEKCPSALSLNVGGVKKSYRYNLDRIRNFAFRMGLPDRQMMICLHRGLSDNPRDKGIWEEISQGIPELSQRAIRKGMQYAPCIEVDVIGRTTGFSGYSPTILSHDTQIAKSYATVELRVPDIFIGDPRLAGCQKGSRFDIISFSYKCSVPQSYFPTSDTFQGAVAGIPSMPFHTNDPYNNITAVRGTLRTPFSAQRSETPDEPTSLRDLLEYIKKCTVNETATSSPIGLVVLDIKDEPGLRNTFAELKRIQDVADRIRIFRHLILKIKPWKFYEANNTNASTNKFAELKNLVTGIEALGIPVMDVIAQAGTRSSLGALPITSYDYESAREYFSWRSETDNGTNFRPVEITMPSSAEYDALASGKQKLLWNANCEATAPVNRTMQEIAYWSVTCNQRLRTGVTATNMKQIWGWVNLETGAARVLQDGNGDSVIVDGQNYNYEVGAFGVKYKFGYSENKPKPQLAHMSAENQPNYVAESIGARVVTIDSRTRFDELFKEKLRVKQDYFLTEIAGSSGSYSTSSLDEDGDPILNASDY
jgi:hypothetical protein